MERKKEVRLVGFVLLLLIAGMGSVVAGDLVILSINSPSDNETVYTETVTVSGTAAAIEGRYIVSVTVNNVSSGRESWSTEVLLQSGNNTITVTATDNFGNQKVKNITVIYEEPWTVLLAIESHYDGQIVYNETITVSGYACCVCGGYIDFVTVNGAYAGLDDWNIEILLQPGNNTITVTATDDLGYSETQIITIFYDDSKSPLIIIDGPTDGKTVYSDTVIVHGAARGRDGVVCELVTVNGINTTGISLWSANVSLVPGENEITVVATDECGRTTTKIITVIYEPMPEVKVDVDIYIDVNGNKTSYNCTCNCNL
jgi:hypothetical protein